jgi:hypothetical protein
VALSLTTKTNRIWETDSKGKKTVEISRNALVRTLAATLLLTASLTTFATEPSKIPPREPHRFYIVLAGFFNSEAPEGFAPEPIAYPVVDLNSVYEYLRKLARQYPPTSACETLSAEKAEAFQKAQLKSKDREAILDRVDAILRVMDEVNQEDAAAAEHVRALRAPFPASDLLRPDDLMLFVVGLESPRRHGDPHVLSAVLGTFWFHGDGANVGSLIKPYNFARLDTDAMKALAAGAFLSPR